MPDPLPSTTFGSIHTSSSSIRNRTCLPYHTAPITSSSAPILSPSALPANFIHPSKGAKS
ncbi:hypothetical protein E2C01_080772 [Portunus trituberculatus]|uniref:Uncharacterized protein n=1 Tax=Portunus trituberculatus TaxID=210409 RepID=A0A5B7IU22_PORTR|nr:hypothetical protein [Portunus trituberculatus]